MRVLPRRGVYKVSALRADGDLLFSSFVLTKEESARGEAGARGVGHAPVRRIPEIVSSYAVGAAKRGGPYEVIR